MIYESYPRCADKSPIIYGEYIARDFNVTFSDGNWHEDPEILIFTKGEGYVLLDSEKISVKPGTIVIANPYSMHNIGTQSTLSYYCIIIDKNFLPENGIALENFCIQSYITDEKLFKRMHTIYDVFSGTDSLRVPKLRVFLLESIVYMFEKYNSDKPQPGLIRPKEKVKQAILYINTNFANHITIDDIAKFVGYSKTHLTREFKKCTMLTIVEYINQVRCSMAKKLLSTGEYSVGEVMAFCGFDNQSYFTKTYKRIIGNLPSNESAKKFHAKI